MAPVVTMRQLLEAGVHFGHQTRRWNPKMKRFIYGERNGIYIIDLQQTLERIKSAYTFLRDLVADGGTVLFVGTKKQAQDPIARAAQGCGMPWVNERWLGGMLTNFTTISGRVSKMQEYQRMRAVGDFDAMPKKEALRLSRELEKLERNLGGIRSMAKPPEAVFVIDTNKEHIGVTEANRLGIPVVAVVDTNCDPDVIDYVVPGNDDAIRSGTLMCRIVSDAVTEGRYIAERRGSPRAVPPPPAEDRAERARRQDQARSAAAREAVARQARMATPRPGDGAAAPSPPGSAEESEALAPTQASVVTAEERGGDPRPDAAPPPSAAPEPEAGAIPAAERDEPPAPAPPEALPGSATTEEPPQPTEADHDSGSQPAPDQGGETQ